MPLRDLGLDARQERVYRAALALGPTELVALAYQLGEPAERTEQAVRSLSELGLLGLEDGMLTVPAPGLAVGELIERREDELMHEYRRVSATRSELGGLERIVAAQPEGGAPRPDIEQLTDPDEISARLEELSFFTRRSVYSVQPGGTHTQRSLEASRPLDLRSLRRGIDMRLIHQTSVLGDETNRVYLRDIVMRGVSVRVTDRPVDRMIIMDEEIAMVPIDPGNGSRGALVVRQPGLVAGFLDLFRHIWDAAQDVPWTAATEDGAAADTITDADRQILQRLASGCTDEIAARELAVSVRHLRRQIARLMGQLGARSRFEAGVEAARRGWL